MTKSPSSPCVRSILRRDLKNDDKESIRNVVRGLRGESDIDGSIDAIKKLIDDNITQSSIAHYMIKHAILEQNEERWFKLFCSMISQSIDLIKPQKLETGLSKVINDMKEIQLDAPHAPRLFRSIVEELGNLNTLLEKQLLLHRIQMVS
jgi:hypothetical protein